MNVLGIDPGLSGALALLGQDGVLLYCADMPTEDAGKGKRRVNPQGLRIALGDMMRLGPLHAFVERVGAMPGQGVTSMFTFGEGCGVIRCALAFAGIPHTYITPPQWKKAAGLRGFAKEHALARARQLVPTAASYLTRKKDLGRADATLIAWYGLQRVDMLP